MSCKVLRIIYHSVCITLLWLYDVNVEPICVYLTMIIAGKHISNNNANTALREKKLLLYFPMLSITRYTSSFSFKSLLCKSLKHQRCGSIYLKGLCLKLMKTIVFLIHEIHYIRFARISFYENSISTINIVPYPEHILTNCVKKYVYTSCANFHRNSFVIPGRLLLIFHQICLHTWHAKRNKSFFVNVNVFVEIYAVLSKTTWECKSKLKKYNQTRRTL